MAREPDPIETVAVELADMFGEDVIDETVATIAGGVDGVANIDVVRRSVGKMLAHLPSATIPWAARGFKLMSRKLQQVSKRKLRAKLEAKGVTKETAEMLVDTVDDTFEAVTRHATNALTAENIQVYIDAAAASTATRRGLTITPIPAPGATGAPMTTIPPAAGSATASPSPVSHKKRLTEFQRNLETADAKRVFGLWFAGIDSAIESDKTGEVVGARKKLYRMRVAVDDDPGGMAEAIEDAAAMYGETQKAVGYIDGMAAMTVSDDRMKDIAGDTGDSVLPTAEMAKAGKSVIKYGMATAQVIVLLVLAALVFSFGGALYGVYKAVSSYSVATAGATIDLKSMGDCAKGLVYAIIGVFSFIGLCLGVKMVGMAIVQAAGEPFAWIGNILRGRFGTEAGASNTSTPH